MQAQIRNISTLTHDHLENDPPADPSNFEIYVRMLIGPADQLGEESFDVKVCTPSWLTAQCQTAGFTTLRRALVVEWFHPETIHRALTDIVTRIHGETWEDIARQLSTIFHWEFEDYRQLPSA